jgi:outer membrane protein TolC
MRRVAALAVMLALGGCASFSPDGGFDAVAEAAREHAGKDVVQVRTPEEQAAVNARVATLLAKPLGVEDAVQVALLNNRGLQASFRELGLAEADLVSAGRLPNPHFSIARSRVGGDVAVEQSVTFNILALATLPLASGIERRRFSRTQAGVSLEVLRLAAETRKAYFQAVAAEESLRYMRQVRTAAEAGAELARRMAEVGNWSTLTRAREQEFHADAALQFARAERAAASERERLARRLGLWGKDLAFRLPERLPDLPRAADDLPDVEQLAMERRLDLRMVRLDAEAQAKNLGLSKVTRLVNVLELGAAREHEHLGGGGFETRRTWEVSFELPIFDFGSARLARAESAYLQVLDRAAEAAVNARSEVREAYRGYRASYDIARHYRDEIVPLRKRVSEENLLRYNGMLIGVFELLADARTQIASVNGAIEALRDFWIARTELDMALLGKPG